MKIIGEFCLPTTDISYHQRIETSSSLFQDLYSLDPLQHPDTNINSHFTGMTTVGPVDKARVDP